MDWNDPEGIQDKDPLPGSFEADIDQSRSFHFEKMGQGKERLVLYGKDVFAASSRSRGFNNFSHG
ncbi:MAG: hypothetical protein HY787_16260 [Deltaproteobacteria bacterium]|nr:hypothetical protein [Deltaproteobacteria bacterium]